MVDTDTMPPDFVATAFVGGFLQRWAYMESDMRDCIEKGLKLGKLEAVMLCSNMSLRDKINLLKTLVSFRLRFDEKERDDFIGVLDGIAGITWMRNMMAHDIFGATEDRQGVQFFVVKAKGNLQFPDTIWPHAKFFEEGERITGFRDGIRKLTFVLDSQNKEERTADDAARMKLISASIAAVYRQLHHPRPVRGSSLFGATEKKDDETPPDPAP